MGNRGDKGRDEKPACHVGVCVWLGGDVNSINLVDSRIFFLYFVFLLFYLFTFSKLVMFFSRASF